MRALAEFIMRGRMQAALVALLGSGFPLISPASVALVTLRRGTSDGTLVLMWGLLPMLVILALGHLSSLLVLAGLVTVFTAALLLRKTGSWSTTLMGLSVLSAALPIVYAVLAPDSVQALVDLSNDALKQMQAQALENGQSSGNASAAQNVQIQAFGKTFVLGMIAYGVLANALVGLLLARWWQAMLYNPGGFQEEFHQLRLNVVQSALCLLATWYCLQQGVDYMAWVNVFALPLLMVGVAIVHSVAKALQLSWHWLVLFYLALLLFSSYFVLLLMMVAFLDIWLDIRRRLKPKT